MKHKPYAGAENIAAQKRNVNYGEVEVIQLVVKPSSELFIGLIVLLPHTKYLFVISVDDQTMINAVSNAKKMIKTSLCTKRSAFFLQIHF